MALPNTAPPGNVSGSGTPNAQSGVQQTFQNPNSIVKQNSQTQKIEEILTNISARLGNITNMRTQAQSAVYDAFGNNFITRGATQITDSVFDTVESVFSKKEEPKEDPIAKALKAQTKVLEKLELSFSGGGNNGANTNFDELIELTKTAETTREKILLKLDAMSDKNKEFYDANITLLEEQKKVADQQLKTFHLLTNRSNRKRRNIDDSNSDDTTAKVESVTEPVAPTTAKVESVTEPVDFDLSEKPANADSKDAPDKDRKEEQREVKQTTLLDKIAATLIDTHKLLKQFVTSGPLSTQETELEAFRNPNVITDVKEGERAPKSSLLKRTLQGITDLEANKMGFLKTVAAVIAGITTVVTFFTSGKLKTLIGILASIGGLLTSGGKVAVPTTLPKASIPVPGKAPIPTPKAPVPTSPPVPSKVGSAIGKFGKIFGRFTLPALAAGIALMGADKGLGALGVGDKEVDVSKDDANWDRMSVMQRAESGAARGIEKVGSFLGLENATNDMRASRIEKETTYLDEQMRKIEQQQREEANRKSAPTPQPSSDGGSKNTVINTSTFVPMKTPVKNTDDSFNRYLTSVLA